MTLSQSAGHDSSGAALEKARTRLRDGDATTPAAQPNRRDSLTTRSKRRVPAKPLDSNKSSSILYDAQSMSRRRSLRLGKDSLTTEELSSTAARPSRGRNPKRASPEGGSLGGRSGRQFTVGNIGNNGRIYLRPIVRPGNELQRGTAAQPAATRPAAVPPASAASNFPDTKPRRASSVGRESVFSSNFSVRKPAEPLPLPPKSRSSLELPRTSSQSGPLKRSVHVRAHSFSTVDEHAGRTSVGRPGTFKVVIHRPGTSRSRPANRARDESPALDVPIPSFRLGRPQFGRAGSATMRSSEYTRNSERRRTSVSPIGLDRVLGSSSRLNLAFGTPKPFPVPLFSRHDSDILVSRNSAAHSTRASTIQAASNVFDDLTANPDDPSVVRFSPVTDEIIAATPSRLIAHITSPSFLDYELLSDFFLTFRCFLLPADLVTFLLTRLRWAVDRADDFGRIVRVRTFVALRHWILNYFIDDFVPDYTLRVHFCNLVNRIFTDLQRRSDGGGGDLKIIGELKKCWRRTCALYWSAGQLVDTPEDDITPGGQIGSIFSNDDIIPPPSVDPTQVSDIKTDVMRSHSQRSKSRKGQTHQYVARASFTSGGQISYQHSAKSGRKAQLSPTSIQSLHVVSCSIPIKPIYRTEADTVVPLFPHPIPVPAQSGTASPGHASAGFPGRGHKRNGSFTDALRDGRAPPSIPQRTSSVPESELAHIPGSLVHGALYQPTSALFHVKTSVPSRFARLHIELPTSKTDYGLPSPSRLSPNGTDGGVKKLLGSVRRALSNNLAWAGNQHATIPNRSLQATYAAEPKQSLSNPEVHILPRPQPRLVAQVQTRIDLLAVKVAESFNQAVAEEMEHELAVQDPSILFPDEKALPKSPSQNLAPGDNRFPLNRSVTVGSRSIVIVDDTNPDLPVMSGALVNDSQEGTLSLYDSYIAKAAAADAMAWEKAEKGVMQSTQPKPKIIDAIASSPIIKSTAPKPAVYVPKGRTTEAAPTVYVPTGYRAEPPVAEQDRLKTRGSRQLFTDSLRADRSPASSLRRYASYHSGLSASSLASPVAPAPVEEDASSNLEPSETDSKASEADASVSDEVPVRQLRRRPGGNLKAVSKVHDLEHQPRPRRHSLGSFSTAPGSVQNSLAYPDSKLDPSARNPVTPSKEEGTETRRLSDTPRRRKSISLIQTHSSQPNLRPSFEAEVAKLKALPDDEDDGGVEAALLKLEGKYEKKTPEQEPVVPPSPPRVPSPVPLSDVTGLDKHRRHHEHVEDIHPEHYVPENIHTRSIYHVSQSTMPKRRKAPDGSIDISEASYSSIPLLERGLSETPAFTATRTTGPSVGPTTERISLPSAHESEIEPPPRINSPPLLSPGSITSFLLDSTQELGDQLDSIIAKSRIPDNRDQMSFFDDGDDDERPTFYHPLRQPDTPPTKLEGTPTKSPLRLNPNIPKGTGLPTPETSPTEKQDTRMITPPPHVPTSYAVERPVTDHVGERYTPSYDSEQPIPAAPSSLGDFPPHMPFILTYDPEILAEQFTIVEKDALDELEWRELIDLRWKQVSPPITDWVTYLRTQDAWGVDLIIARFNLMVKWVLSELVLTEDVNERARCIVHYIRIAAASRQIRNFATMYQITVALLSADCTRMKKTWRLVPQSEINTLRDLETIVQPLRNFHNLRVEMETGSGDDGCIPFIGIYTHDLMYNAQKPLVISSPPTNPFEPLVNFERHHTAATIVKNLLRLLEASSRYKFQPDPAVLSKCLWMASLDEKEISERSKLLE